MFITQASDLDSTQIRTTKQKTGWKVETEQLDNLKNYLSELPDDINKLEHLQSMKQTMIDVIPEYDDYKSKEIGKKMLQEIKNKISKLTGELTN